MGDGIDRPFRDIEHGGQLARSTEREHGRNDRISGVQDAAQYPQLTHESGGEDLRGAGVQVVVQAFKNADAFDVDRAGMTSGRYNPTGARLVGP